MDAGGYRLIQVATSDHEKQKNDINKYWLLQVDTGGYKLIQVAITDYNIQEATR